MRSRRSVVSLLLVALVAVLAVSAVQAAPNVRYLGTWNMGWLGGASPNSNDLDDTKYVADYADQIEKSGATFVAVQEIVPTHAAGGTPRCHYLDLIALRLSEDTKRPWTYVMDGVNGGQRLGYLYDCSEWVLLGQPESVKPGSSYNYLRQPFVVQVQAIGPDATLVLNMVSVHMKAFLDESERRKAQFDELATWIGGSTLGPNVVICGDTNIYDQEASTDASPLAIGYAPPSANEAELTCMYLSGSTYVWSQRFDRFYISPGIKPEVSSAEVMVGSEGLVDSHRESVTGTLGDFHAHVSDHVVVTLAVDVSEERN